MISVDEARALVAARAAALPPAPCELDAALGLVLAEEVASDVDSPPFDKALVDGYAVIAADLAGGPATLEVHEQVTAGQVPRLPLGRGRATRIMTGAPLPEGADAVVMVERTRAIADGTSPLGRVHIADADLQPGRNLLPRAAAMRAGERVLARGQRLTAAAIGLLAEVGRRAVLAVPRPRVGILSTGDELVPPEAVPAPGQIRNSNGPMLAAQVAAAGAMPLELGIARDEPAELSAAIARGLAADVLVISGGVSAGLLDLVPAVLAQAAVEPVFHKVNLKPGKPLWFGCGQGSPSPLVFGLPGNPVSSFVCFALFVEPALAALAGRPNWERPLVQARLCGTFRQRADRPVYHPAVVRGGISDREVEPLQWQGSADLRTLAQANALVHFPCVARTFETGEVVEVLLVD